MSQNFDPRKVGILLDKIPLPSINEAALEYLYSNKEVFNSLIDEVILEIEENIRQESEDFYFICLDSRQNRYWKIFFNLLFDDYAGDRVVLDWGVLGFAILKASLIQSGTSVLCTFHEIFEEPFNIGEKSSEFMHWKLHFLLALKSEFTEYRQSREKQDAERYDYIKNVPMDLWSEELKAAMRCQMNAVMDSLIDKEIAKMKETQ